MEANTRKGTLSDAIESVTTMDIIEAFDIPHKTRRGRIYLLCPGHDDKHFGSCYVDKNDNGYYCYVCGEHVDKWDMVLKLNGNRKADAYEWFFKMAGMTPTALKQNDPLRHAQRLIKQIEVYLRNDIVYNDIYTCEKSDSSYGRNEKGEYLYSELSITNPLMELYKTDKSTFQNVVLDLLYDKIDKVSTQVKNYRTDSSGCIYVESVGLISNEELANACEEYLTDLQLLVTAVHKM